MSTERTKITDFTENLFERKLLAGSIVCESSKYASTYHIHVSMFHGILPRARNVLPSNKLSIFRFDDRNIDKSKNKHCQAVHSHKYMHLSNRRWRGHVPLRHDFPRSSILLNMDACLGVFDENNSTFSVHGDLMCSANARTNSREKPSFENFDLSNCWKLVSFRWLNALRLNWRTSIAMIINNRMNHFTCTIKFKRFKIISNRDGNWFAPVYSFFMNDFIKRNEVSCEMRVWYGSKRHSKNLNRYSKVWSIRINWTLAVAMVLNDFNFFSLLMVLLILWFVRML